MSGNTSSAGDASRDAASADRLGPQKRVKKAIKAVRREGYKVAVIYAFVDAALVALGLNLLFELYTPSGLPASVPLPAAIQGPLAAALPYGFPDAIATGTIIGVVAGALVLVGEVVFRVRRPLVEQFEAANPSIQEALRTARDAVREGRDNRMTVALYEDVLARLRETSSVGLLNLRRLTVTLVIVVAVSLVSVQVAVVDLDLGDFVGNGQQDGEPGGTPDQDRPQDAYGGLQNGSDILGDPTDVSAGRDEINATLPTQGGGTGGTSGPPSAYDSGGFSGSGDVESQQAGFAESEQLEDADLIREYNLKIRSTDDE